MIFGTVPVPLRYKPCSNKQGLPTAAKTRLIIKTHAYNSMATSIDQSSVGWRFENTYAQLPEVFYREETPTSFSVPRVSIFNQRLAEELGLDFAGLTSVELAAIFTGQARHPHMRPIAQAYAGHQFGSFTMLGDGRAILLGEQRTPTGQLVDIQLKGSGRTSYSRGGDGFAALGPMLREYIISEAMFALGIPTTRSLAVVETGESVYRATTLRGAVLTRVAASHLRVGTFQYAAATRNETFLQALADYAIERHFPELAGSTEKYLEFFRGVTQRQAALIAQWQLVGFIHGVMNTDNMAISGETIDYGPCAFMNSYDPQTVFSSIDRGGRYAYGNQPLIAQWNLARLAETLLPLLHTDLDQAIGLARTVLEQFTEFYEQSWLAGMRKKLGLQTEAADDRELAKSLLDWMLQTQADFTNTFRDLSSDRVSQAAQYQTPEFQSWHAQWQQRLQREQRPLESIHALMRSANPAVIPRNHRVEEALTSAQEHGDLSVLHRLLAVLAEPFEEREEIILYRDPPACADGYQTFCGT